MLRTVRQAEQSTARSWHARDALALGQRSQQQRQLDNYRIQHGDEVVANRKMKPTLRLRHLESSPSDSGPKSVPATMTRPDVARSIPAMRLSSVVLPEPDGPINARNSPCGTSRLRPSELNLQAITLIHLAQVLYADGNGCGRRWGCTHEISNAYICVYTYVVALRLALNF